MSREHHPRTCCDSQSLQSSPALLLLLIKLRGVGNSLSSLVPLQVHLPKQWPWLLQERAGSGGLLCFPATLQATGHGTGHCLQDWDKKYVELLEWVQRSAMKITGDLEHLCYEDRLKVGVIQPEEGKKLQGCKVGLQQQAINWKSLTASGTAPGTAMSARWGRGLSCSALHGSSLIWVLGAAFGGQNVRKTLSC